MNSHDAIDQLRDAMKVRNYSDSTASNYTRLVNGFFEFVKGQPTGQTFPEYVKAYILRLRYFKRPTWSASSVNLCRDAIAFFAANVMNPPVSLKDIPRMKEPKALPEPMTTEEIQTIFAHENNRKHLLMLQVAYYGCVRLGDLMRMKVKDVRFDRGLIHIIQGKGKKDRLIPFPDCIHDVMKAHITGLNSDDYVFTPSGSKNPYPKRTIQKIAENACRRAEIVGRWNIHRFRHTGATDLVQNGVNLRIIQDILGHASPKTTMLYTRVAASDISNMRNVLVEATKVS
jgi:integrase